jgi:hypothetical protein
MRRVVLAAVLLAACGSGSVDRTGSHTAAERAHKEYAASGEAEPDPPKGSSWGGWRYQGARDDCFFVVGRACFDSEARACKAAKCGKKKKCTVDGGGPATVSCK